MASLIPGFEYDVFISYRQKDNKHDGWVTEFVDNLKGELEATFKEDISVYFDINLHDGLLETHDVDASLKDKLKCLIFIPIVSRTYCDPKSFAWEHEFKAFIEQASKDKIGLKTKLLNGNVSSRVLPVRIHDLDNNDIELCESILGGVMRGIEFIYKESGFNRPLKPDDDEKINLNKTKYRNQISKVALAIKETISSIGNDGQKSGERQKEVIKPLAVPLKSNRTKILAGSVILSALIILGYFFIPRLSKPNEQLEKSIAVLPFKLLSDEPDKQYLADGMMDAILLHLSKIKDLRVMSRTSVEQYRNPNKSTTAIGQELGVEYLLEGSFQKFGDNVRLIIQLIKTGQEGHVWANNYDRNWNDVFLVQSEVAQTIARELQAAITPEEKQLIEKTPTVSLTAYDFYQRGKEAHSKSWINFIPQKTSLQKAGEFYRAALKYDSTFAQAYTGLARVYWDTHYSPNYLLENFQDSANILCDIALSFDPELPDAYTLKGLYYSEIGQPEQAIKEFDKAIELDPNDWMAYRGKGDYYQDRDFINNIYYLQKATALNHGPEFPDLLVKIGYAYFCAGFPEKSRYFYLERLKLY
jgi:TolB-like protein